MSDSSDLFIDNIEGVGMVGMIGGELGDKAQMLPLHPGTGHLLAEFIYRFLYLSDAASASRQERSPLFGFVFPIGHRQGFWMKNLEYSEY